MSASDPLITIFTTPKPFTNPHIHLIQRNAILSWHCLGEEVNVFMIGDEPGMAEFAVETGTQHLTQVDRNPLGTPLVSSIFATAHQISSSPILAYVNADILLTSQFVDVVRQIYSRLKKFIIVGQRYSLNVQAPIDFSPGWDLHLLSDVQIHGHLQPPGGSDYFIFPHSCFTAIPKFAIGRGGWDNWMLFHARAQGFLVVDATSSIVAVHQVHDYSHLPNGQPHFRLPESSENIRLAGGPQSIFTLADADCYFRNGHLQRIPLTFRKLFREIEIFPIIHWHSQSLANTLFSIFHPIKTWNAWRNQAASRETGQNLYG